MAKIKDSEYLTLATRIHAMEGSLLTKERMERVLEARTDEEAVKVLSECGYRVPGAVTPESVETMLSQRREALFRELAGAMPDPRVLDVFRAKQDYHNLKVLLKAEALGGGFDRLLVDTGRVSPKEMKELLSGTRRGSLPEALDRAAKQGREVLSATGDPQRLDFCLDRACFAELGDLARGVGSDYLAGYVALQVDVANLRCLVRAVRMKKSPDFLKGILFEGGSVPLSRVLAVAQAEGSGLAELYASTPLRTCAELGAAAVRGGSLTAFEKECDNCLTRYLAQARRIPFGEAPVIGYLAAVEGELTNLRILLSGRMAGLEPETIRERLREGYV